MLTALTLIALTGFPQTYTLYMYESLEAEKHNEWSMSKEDIPTLRDCINTGNQEKEFLDILGRDLGFGVEVTFKCITE